MLPERATEDLPRAVEAIRARGLEVPMLTTELTSAADPNARPILSTAARLKIPFFKLGYWPYRTDPVADLQKAAADVRGLVELAKEYGITAGFHNHPRMSDSPAGMDGKWSSRSIRSGLGITTIPTMLRKRARSWVGK